MAQRGQILAHCKGHKARKASKVFKVPKAFKVRLARREPRAHKVSRAILARQEQRQQYLLAQFHPVFHRQLPIEEPQARRYLTLFLKKAIPARRDLKAARATLVQLARLARLVRLAQREIKVIPARRASKVYKA